MNFTPLDPNHEIALELSKEDEIAKRFRSLMDLHGLYDWKFEFSNDIHTVGWCWYKEKTLKFSRKYTHHGWDEIEDTILHEIAHALVGPKVKAHGYEWQAMARRIGARPKTCAESHVRPKDVPDFKYVIKCPKCDKKWYRHRMKKRNFGSKCPRCHVPVQIFKLRRKDA